MLWLFVYSFKQINYNQFKLCETFRKIIVSGILFHSYVDLHCVVFSSASSCQAFAAKAAQLIDIYVYR